MSIQVAETWPWVYRSTRLPFKSYEYRVMTLTSDVGVALQSEGGATAVTQSSTWPTLPPHESTQICSAMLCAPLTRVFRISWPSEL